MGQTDFGSLRLKYFFHILACFLCFPFTVYFSGKITSLRYTGDGGITYILNSDSVSSKKGVLACNPQGTWKHGLQADVVAFIKKCD